MNTLRIVACATLFGAAHAALGDFSASHAPPDTLAPDWNFMTDDASVTYHVEPATYGINTADINAKIYYAGDLGDKYGYKITNSSFWVPGITAADLKGAIILAMRGGGNYAGKAASAQALGAAASITMQSDPNAMQTTMFFIAPKVHIPSFIVDVATGAKIKAQMVTFSYTWAAGASGKPAAATIAANAARKIALDALLATATSAANWEECSRLAAQIANVGPITATGTCAAYNAATGCTGSTKSAGRTFSLTGSTAAAASDITALANMYKSFDALPTATARATWKIGQWGPYNLKGTNTSDWKPLEAEITTAGSVTDVCGITGNKLWGIWCEGGRVTRIMVGGGGAGFVGGKWALTAAAVNGLTGLKKLYLASASLINALPTGMTALPELVMFDVHNNADLTGEVPAGIGLHTKLKQLDLLNCKFTGIHADVGDATALTQIYASKNSITSFPAKVQNMPNLIILSAADNKITSFAFETTSKLKYLDISGNGIVGALPSFAGATQLIDVKISGNKFTGNPSAAFNNCPQLKTVNVADNMLTGTAPILTGSPKVVSLDFSQNKLAAFPDEWILAPPAALATITMNNNLVISPVKALVNLPKLATLNLAHNKLSSLADGAPAGHNAKTFIEWTVPESIVSLDLSHNLIDGIMCPNGGSYAACTYKNGYLRNLQTLDMSNNPLLQGTLGEEYLTTMSSPVLKSMNFENCDLSGALPDPGTNMQKTPITINVKNNTKMTWGAGAALPGWVTQGGLKQAPGAKFSCPELFHLGALVGIDSSYYGSTLCVCGRGFWGPGNQCQDFPSVATATTATAGKVSDDFNSANAQPHERLSKGITTDFPIRVPAGTGNTTVLAIEATIDTSKMLSTESLQVRYKDAKGKEQFLVAKFNATVDSVPGGCKIVPGAAAAVVCYALGTDITAKFTSPLTDNAVSFTIDYKALTSCPAGSTILEVNAVTKKSSCVQPKVSLTAEFTLDGVSTSDIGADMAKFKASVKQALADKLGVDVSAIRLLGDPINTARRRLAGGMKIQYAVSCAEDIEVGQISNKAASSSFASALTAAVKKEAQTQGIGTKLNKATVSEKMNAPQPNGVCVKGTQLFAALNANNAFASSPCAGSQSRKCYKPDGTFTTQSTPCTESASPSFFYRTVTRANGEKGCCVPCSPGSYKDTDANDKLCRVCGPRSFATEYGASSCMGCNLANEPARATHNGDGTDETDLKDSDKYPLHTSCKCTVGFFGVNTKAHTKYMAGSSTARPDNILCVACHKGAYCPNEGNKKPGEKAMGITFEDITADYGNWQVTTGKFYKTAMDQEKLVFESCSTATGKKNKGQSWCTGGNYSFETSSVGNTPSTYIKDCGAANSGCTDPLPIRKASCGKDSTAKNCGCQVGHMGPLCAVCKKGYRMGFSNSCDECSEDNKDGTATYVTLAVFGAILLGFLAFFRQIHSWANEKKEQLNALRKRSQAHLGEMFGGDEMVDFESGFYNFFTGGGDSNLSFKIILGLCQVVPQFDFIFTMDGFQWPPALRELFGGLTVVNLQFSQFPSFGCLVETNFVDDFLMTAMIPIFLISIVVVLHLIAAKIKKTWFRKRNNLLRAFFGILFVTFPGCASTTLRMFSCKKLASGEEYLQADMWIRCDDDTQMVKTWFGENNYAEWRKAAIFFVIVYPIGVPLAFFIQLYANRKNLYERNEKGQVMKKHDSDTGRILGYKQDKATGKRIGMLYLSYKPNYWWWEVMELIRKLTITGMIIFVMPGTSSQFAFGCLLSLFFMMFYVGCRPYCDSTNSALQTICQMAIFLMLFAGLLMASQVSKDDNYDSSALEGMLVFITVFPIVLGGIMIIYTYTSMFCTDFITLCKNGGKKNVTTTAVGDTEAPKKVEGGVIAMDKVDVELAQLEKSTGEA